MAAALISSLHDIALPSETIFCGEVGLSGEIRSVGQMDARLKEAAKLGFRQAYIPERRRTQNSNDLTDLSFTLNENKFLVDMISDLVPENDLSQRVEKYVTT